MISYTSTYLEFDISKEEEVKHALEQATTILLMSEMGSKEIRFDLFEMASLNPLLSQVFI